MGKTPTGRTARRLRGTAGVHPITHFFVNVRCLDKSPLRDARTQALVEVAAACADRKDPFLASLQSPQAVTDWARAILRFRTTRLGSPDDLEPLLPPQSELRPTLVLDLDGTLLYSSPTPVETALPVIPIPDDTSLPYVYFRPHVHAFLAWAREHFEVVAWTAATEAYARERLSAGGISDYFDHLLFRDSCTVVGDLYVKSLRRLGRRLDECLIVDDNPASYLLNVENAYPIPTFVGEDNDQELLRLVPTLRKIIEMQTVRHGVFRLVLEDSAMHRALQALA
ncbi:Nuclear LIM interactor-interacting factor 1 [Giardia muris]|uniref:Mitochondrial import inner membrane translocase subunit TIM50 n=1 Tax=Giardia muris TaxID=5742 RepID=A0A4Z1SXM7_GIAMU|nr:Nuclear LIM interactor-interacting factor 1 [Giardia muris]|eukprot:TNJ26443.1 Nuclear LIM interactor-interacting factor 1 [Giardia muris]